MLSKIQIDLDQDNRPIITVQHKKFSEDLRDKVVQKFIEGIQGAQAVECFFEDTGLFDDPIKSQKLILRPFQSKDGLHNIRKNLLDDIAIMRAEVAAKGEYHSYFSVFEGLINKHFSILGEAADTSFETAEK